MPGAALLYKQFTLCALTSFYCSTKHMFSSGGQKKCDWAYTKEMVKLSVLISFFT